LDADDHPLHVRQYPQRQQDGNRAKDEDEGQGRRLPFGGAPEHQRTNEMSDHQERQAGRAIIRTFIDHGFAAGRAMIGDLGLPLR
jgi:hypothetical protein